MRFAVVGVINTAIDFFVFILLYYKLGIFLVGAHIFGFLVATINSYIMNKFWTFGEKEPTSLKQFSTFLLVTTLALILSTIVIYIAAKFIPAWLAKLVAIGITLVWNYIGMHLFVFKEK